MKKKIVVFADGGARGNPGPAAIGFLIKESDGQVLVKKGKLIGKTTNNVAEYMAVVGALKWLEDNFKNSTEIVESIEFFLDSKLVVCQLNGLYKVKAPKLRELIIKVRQLEQAVGGNIHYSHIPREKNKEADALVNQSFKNAHH